MTSVIGWALIGFGFAAGYAFRDLVELWKDQQQARVRWPSWLAKPRGR